MPGQAKKKEETTMTDFYSWRYLGGGAYGVYHVYPPTDGERAKTARVQIAPRLGQPDNAFRRKEDAVACARRMNKIARDCEQIELPDWI